MTELIFFFHGDQVTLEVLKMQSTHRLDFGQLVYGDGLLH